MNSVAFLDKMNFFSSAFLHDLCIVKDLNFVGEWSCFPTAMHMTSFPRLYQLKKFKIREKIVEED